MKKITLNNIRQYLEGNSRMMLDNVGLVGEHIQEQIAYRMLLCKGCLDVGACEKCGCSVPGKLYVSQSCNPDKFPDLMNEEDWNNFKEANDVK